MDNSSEIAFTNGSDVSDYFFQNSSCNEIVISENSVVDIIVILLGFPLNSYVIWLIVTGSRNGLLLEFFSLNLSICEILGLESVFLNLFLKCKYDQHVLLFFEGLAFSGRPLFQCLMCVERYLAVVHPVTFLKYKPLRYRVICCAVVWIANVICGGLNIIVIVLSFIYFYIIFSMAQFSIFLSVQSFCLVAVLRALKQSGPGERKREKEQNRMKRRAFYIILITTMTVLISFVFYMILFMLLLYYIITDTIYIMAYNSLFIAGLVQPLFFLYRMRKLPFVGCR